MFLTTISGWWLTYPKNMVIVWFNMVQKSHWWSYLVTFLVGGWPTPLKNHGLRQLGWHFPFPMEKYNSCAKAPDFKVLTMKPLDLKLINNQFLGSEICPIKQIRFFFNGEVWWQGHRDFTFYVKKKAWYTDTVWLFNNICYGKIDERWFTLV